MDPDQKFQEAGFTTVEIIAVLLLLAVITSVIVSRYSTGTVDAAASADKLKVHLRYTQMRAMNSDVSWGMSFSGTGYSLIRDMGGSQTVQNLPGESDTSVSLPASVTGSVQFDTWGRPSGLDSISLGTVTVTITPDTGFIP